MENQDNMYNILERSNTWTARNVPRLTFPTEKKKIFLFPKLQNWLLEPPSLPLSGQWGIRQPGREGDHSSYSSAEVKN